VVSSESAATLHSARGNAAPYADGPAIAAVLIAAYPVNETRAGSTDGDGFLQPPPHEVIGQLPPTNDRARKNLDRHPNYILAAFMASGT
jgi:hypothetical protein